MAFVKRTWMARIGTGLNKFIIGEKDANDKQTLVNSPDSVTQQGDVISADNLNDLEDRIEEAFGADSTRMGNIEASISGMKLTKIWENPYPNSVITVATNVVLDIHPPFSLMIEYSFDVESWASVSNSGNRSFVFLKKLADSSNSGYITLSSSIGWEDAVTHEARMEMNSRNVSFLYSAETNKTTMTIDRCYHYKMVNTTPSVEFAGRYLVPQSVYIIGDIYNS